MLGYALGFRTRGNGFSAGYNAVLNFATSQGMTLPSASQQAKQNTLYLALEAAGALALMDRLFIFASDGNSDFACVNWAAPSVGSNCFRVASPIFTANQGFTGDGVGAYLDSNFDPTTAVSPKFVQNSASVGVWVRTAGSVAARIFGQISSDFNQTRTANSVLQRVNASVNAAASINFTGTGLIHLSRQNAIGIKGYTNTTETPTTQASIPFIGSDIAFLRAGVNYGNGQISAAFIGSDLSALNTSIYNALNTYLTSL